mmetsp:Transcript_4390/g.5763  ORF Transcript_4390/g.5763 Transcript_4390/m.5763 type:complete len:215 (+) Transcript_4390:44-688(+)
MSYSEMADPNASANPIYPAAEPIKGDQDVEAVVSQPTTTFGHKPIIPHGKWRSGLCDVLSCPMCCVALFCPFVIFAQAHKQVHGGDDPKKGMIGYYAILIGITIVTTLGMIAESSGSAGFVQAMTTLGWGAGFFISVSLLRRIRLMYSIRGDCDYLSEKCPHLNFCGCCNDGCCDVSKSVFCQCCTAYQIGNHLFDYQKNNEVTYEPVPTHFVV